MGKYKINLLNNIYLFFYQWLYQHCKYFYFKNANGTLIEIDVRLTAHQTGTLITGLWLHCYLFKKEMLYLKMYSTHSLDGSHTAKDTQIRRGLGGMLPEYWLLLIKKRICFI